MTKTAKGYLQHKAGPNGPFRTEHVELKQDVKGRFWARFEGRWRFVWFSGEGRHIMFQKERIAILITIEGEKK